MFNFFGLRKETTKRLTPEKETDGFVLIGETAEEQHGKLTNTNIVQQETNTSSWPGAVNNDQHKQTTEGAPLSSDVLADIPFTLAPHVLVLQTSFPDLPHALLLQDMNENLAKYEYDFSLENTVLYDS
ncbi:UBAP1-MVB12-associated (UMA)-domain containing protein 1 [Polypterus senegalus]